MVLLPQGIRDRPFPAGFLAETHVPPYPCDYATPLNINQAEQGVAGQRPFQPLLPLNHSLFHWRAAPALKRPANIMKTDPTKALCP